MKSIKNRILLLVIGFLLLGITACGYKPSSAMIKNIFADSVYVEVKVDTIEPENAPFVKDELNRMVYTHFKGGVVSKDQAESKIIVTYRGTSFGPLTYENGYVVRYRADIRVKFDMLTKQGKFTKSISARHEADIQASSFYSSTLRTEAIRKGLEKALNEFLAYASAKGAIVEKKGLTSKK